MRRIRWDRMLLLATSTALCIFGIVCLIGYGVDWLGSRQTARELNALYEHGPEEPRQVEVAAPQLSVDFSAAVQVLPSDQETDLSPFPYPCNPMLAADERFDAARQKNPDIIGWLSVGGLLREPVVQRDNVYYVTHDAQGKRNNNGAIFLDANADLSTRPYTLILYGHNMKSGAMFGCLRNYEYADFCKRHPILTFNTLYEEGRYAIFAVSKISDRVIDENYVDLFKLSTSMKTAERQSAIDSLEANSMLRFQVDVRPDDQLLLMVTCTDREAERRVVAARRLRESE